MRSAQDKDRGGLKNAIGDARLYGILDMGYVSGDSLMEVARDLIDGGVGVIQLRAKKLDAQGVLGLLQSDASELVQLCKSSNVPFIVNDFPEVALAVEADGVHVGQDDGSLREVRDVVGEDMLVGHSTHSPEQAKAAMEEGFDYIGFGPLFPTPTKQGRPGIGLDHISKVEHEVGQHIPMFCIGGIKPQNLELVLASGARRVVIVSALLQAEDIASATKAVASLLA